jgi:hypothetical protein
LKAFGVSEMNLVGGRGEEPSLEELEALIVLHVLSVGDV